MPAISYARGALGDRVAGVMQIDPLAQSRERAFIEEQMGRTALDTAKWELQAKKEAWNAAKKQADTSGALATQFLSMWGGSMSDLKSMFGAAGEGLKNVTSLLAGTSGGSTGLPAEMKDYLGTINSLQDMVKQQYQTYQQESAPIRQELWQGVKEETAGRRAITQRLLEAGQAKPDEAAARAGTDVKLAAEINEREAMRNLMSMGVDPSSGRFGALSRRSAIQTAGEQAKAMNAARIAERNRATQVNLSTMGQLNPAQLAAAGTAITGEGTKMLGTIGQLAQTGADIYGKQQAIDLQRLQGLTQLGTSYGNLATQYAGAITQPLGELAGYYLGKSGGAIDTSMLTSPSTATAARTTTTTPARTTALASPTYAVGNASRNIALAQSQGTKGANYLYGIDTAEPQYY